MKKTYAINMATRCYRHLMSLVVVLFSLAGSAFAQAPANDDPCGAVVLTPSGQLCTAPTVGNLQGATTTTPNGYSNQNTCGGTFGQPLDVWYKFTTTPGGLGGTGATLTVAGNAATQLRLFSAASCAGPFAELGCRAATTPNTAAPALSTTALAANTTYYVRVAGNAPGPFTICLTDGPGVPVCLPLVVRSPVYTNPDNSAATVAFIVNSSHLAPYRITISQYVGTTLVQLQRYTTSSTAPVVLTGLIPGERYDVEVYAFCAGGGVSQVRTTFTVPAPNDNPCGAYPLLVDPVAGCTPQSGTAGGATPTVPNGYTTPGCGAAIFGSIPPNDVWYSFRTAASGPGSTAAVVTLGNTSSAGMLRLFAASTCGGPFAEVACVAVQAGQVGPFALTAANLLPNTRYFVSVALINDPAFNPNSGFTICASAQAPAQPCPALARLVVALALIRPTTAALAILLAPGSRQPAGYTVTYAPTNGGPPTTLTLVPTADPMSPLATTTILTGLTPNTAYTVTVVANCVGGTTSPPLTITFTTSSGPVVVPGPPPANDNCTTAQVLAVGTTCVPTAGTTLDATVSAAGTPLLDCAAYPSPADVWYRLTVPASGTVQVRLDSVAGSGLRGASLAFYTGSCASLTPLQCIPGDGRDFATGRVAGVPGSTVYVRVWAELSAGNIYPANGPFTICALDSPSPCPLVTNVAVSAITTTTASVSFVPGAGNTGFAVTATPVGGGASVLESDSSSPIVLTGLLPGTNYLVSVASFCAGGNGLGPGVLAFFTTLTPPVVCPAPTAFYVGTVTGTTASVNFTPTPGTTYVLTYAAAAGPTQTLPVTTSPVSLTGLLVSTPYTVTLQATCAVGPAPLLTTRFTTTSGCPTPLFTTVSALSSTTATIRFTAPGGTSGYTATLTPVGGTVQVIAPAPGGSPFTLTGLVPGTGYTLALRSACAGGSVSAADTVRFVTLTPVTTCATPAAVAVSSLGGTTATVTFTGPAGAIGYTAAATPTAGGAIVTSTGVASPLQLTGLVPGTGYTVTVTTRCGAGTASAPTSATGFTTLLASRLGALADQLTLYPNPAHRSATLTVPAALLRQAGLLTLSDALGRTVRQRFITPTGGAATDTRAELDLTGLPTGVYLVRLLSSAGPLTKRLVIE